MTRDSHYPQHHHHHDDLPIDPFTSDEPGRRGPGRGRGHRRGPGRGGPSGFGPRGRQRRPRGALREAILSLLAEQPANGYALMQQVSERTEGEWSPSPGSVYPTLAQLVDEGLIIAEDTEKGTDYALSDAGRAHVADHAEEIAGVWEGSAQGSASRMAMRDSVSALMGVLQQFRHAATDDQRQRAVEQLDETRRALYRILAD
jgi:DNA-binding PadR family transcriptional regulator